MTNILFIPVFSDKWVRKENLGEESLPNYLNGNRYANVQPVRIPWGLKTSGGQSLSNALLCANPALAWVCVLPKDEPIPGSQLEIVCGLCAAEPQAEARRFQLICTVDARKGNQAFKSVS